MRFTRLCGVLLTVLVVLAPLPALAETVWIDVRSSLEHMVDSVAGDTRISYSDIVPEVQARYPDKTTQIKLYCRSGGRSEQATMALREAGYTQVENIGGIDDARKYRGLSE